MSQPEMMPPPTTTTNSGSPSPDHRADRADSSDHEHEPLFTLVSVAAALEPVGPCREKRRRRMTAGSEVEEELDVYGEPDGCESRHATPPPPMKRLRTPERSVAGSRLSPPLSAADGGEHSKPRADDAIDGEDDATRSPSPHQRDHRQSAPSGLGTNNWPAPEGSKPAVARPNLAEEPARTAAAAMDTDLRVPADASAQASGDVGGDPTRIQAQSGSPLAPVVGADELGDVERKLAAVIGLIEAQHRETEARVNQSQARGSVLWNEMHQLQDRLAKMQKVIAEHGSNPQSRTTWSATLVPVLQSQFQVLRTAHSNENAAVNAAAPQLKLLLDTLSGLQKARQRVQQLRLHERKIAELQAAHARDRHSTLIAVSSVLGSVTKSASSASVTAQLPFSTPLGFALQSPQLAGARDATQDPGPAPRDDAALLAVFPENALHASPGDWKRMWLAAANHLTQPEQNRVKQLRRRQLSCLYARRSRQKREGAQREVEGAVRRLAEANRQLKLENSLLKQQPDSDALVPATG